MRSITTTTVCLSVCCAAAAAAFAPTPCRHVGGALQAPRTAGHFAPTAAASPPPSPPHLGRLLPPSSHSRGHRRRTRQFWKPHRRTLQSLYASADDDNDKEKLDDKGSDAPAEKEVGEEKKPLTSLARDVQLQSSSSAKEAAFGRAFVVPTAVTDVLIKIWEFARKVRYHFLTFAAGAAVALAALLIPLSTVTAPLAQPVALFETILGDLEQAYVEPVDTQKLFETGVSAMLSSLDPYTEFEGAQEAVQLTESIDGRYGGVGLVIAGIPAREGRAAPPKIAPDAAKRDAGDEKTTDQASSPTPSAPTISNKPSSTTKTATISALEEFDDDDDDDDDIFASGFRERRAAAEKRRNQGIRVVSAFEGYAFDYGLRVGDRLLAVDDVQVNEDTSVEQVRNVLRGEPGTLVTIAFERDGVDGVQTVVMPRTVVRIRDVKLATLVGRPEDGIGYIQLSGFASDTGREVRNAITYLQQAAEDATRGERSLQGLILDLRGNPGGLLTSAVDVASLLVPKGSDIVSAKGRGFPGLVYRSRVDPILDTDRTRLAVLINGGTASAAEIVSGAVQDLDVGIIVGSDRTFGKGLVQNVEELPFNTALKYTVAKYYTPSGRCIQGVNYQQGQKADGDGRYVASKVDDQDREVYYTRTGRTVRDGGGIEADYKVPAPKASALEVTLLRSGVFNEFAAEWSKTHELTNNFHVDEDTYRNFQAFVSEKQKNGDLELEALYSKPLADLKKALKRSGYKGSEKSVEQLQARIVRDIQHDFEKYRSDIKEDISQNILARYLPESMLIERGIQSDGQVEAAVKLLSSRREFDKLLTKGSALERNDGATSTLNVASNVQEGTDGFRARIDF